MPLRQGLLLASRALEPPLGLFPGSAPRPAVKAEPLVPDRSATGLLKPSPVTDLRTCLGYGSDPKALYLLPAGGPDSDPKAFYLLPAAARLRPEGLYLLPAATRDLRRPWRGTEARQPGSRTFRRLGPICSAAGR